MPSFENPAAFLLLLAFPLIFILRTLGFLEKPSFNLTLSDWNGQTFAFSGGFFKVVSLIGRFFLSLSFVFIILAAADPVIHRDEKVYTSKGAEILFVLDISPSMAAKDTANMTRLDAARTGIKTLLAENKGASFGLVAMASEAASVVPPTSDSDAFLKRLDSLVIGSLGEGSAIGTGLSSAVYHLSSSSAPKKCIILITDGENNAGAVHPQTAASLAYEKGISLFVWGIGSSGSAPIEYVDPKSGKVRSGYYDSEFDSRPLEELALKSGGKYFDVATTEALSAAISEVSRSQASNQSFFIRPAGTSLYERFLLVAVILFIFSEFLLRVVNREVF